jgi:thioredoxin 1
MSDSLIVLNESELDQFITESDCPILIEFWAKWCPSCLIMGEVLKSLSQKYIGKIKICTIDVDKNPKISESIEYTPTIIFFSSEKVVAGAIEGAVSEDVVSKAIDAVLEGKKFEIDT